MRSGSAVSLGDNPTAANWLRTELQASFVNQLTWFQVNTQLEILSDLPEADMLKIAESMKPAAP